MGRTKKNPDQEGTATATVRINRTLAEKAKLVAKSKGIAASDLLDSIIGDRIDASLSEWREKVINDIAKRDAENPDWRKPIEHWASIDAYKRKLKRDKDILGDIDLVWWKAEEGDLSGLETFITEVRELASNLRDAYLFHSESLINQEAEGEDEA